MTVRFTTPTGMVGTIKMKKPEKKLSYFDLKYYVSYHLKKRGIEFKKFVIV